MAAPEKEEGFHTEVSKVDFLKEETCNICSEANRCTFILNV
jgi:hypothetical protein